MNTKVASRRQLGDNTRRDLGDTHLWTHNSWSHVMSDHAVISFLIPLAPDRTLVRTKWLVHEDALEGVDYALSDLIEVWRRSMRRTLALLRSINRVRKIRVTGPDLSRLSPSCIWNDFHAGTQRGWKRTVSDLCLASRL